MSLKELDSLRGRVPLGMPSDGGLGDTHGTPLTGTTSSVTITDSDNDNVTVTVSLDTAAKGVFTSASLTASSNRS